MIAPPQLAQLRAVALAQPNAQERASGMIKFAGPACVAEGHDAHQDNAAYFEDTGTWGCAFAPDTPLGRAHWEAIGQALGAFATRNGQAAAAWGAPQPIPTALPSVPAFDAARLLPPGVAPWIADIAERTQCPPDYAAIAALCAAGAVLGRQLTIRPKQRDDWTVVANVWGAAIGPPGVMKSPALRQALKPLHRLVAEAHETYQAQLEVFQFDEHKAKVKKQLLQTEMKAAMKSGGDGEAYRDAFTALERDTPTVVTPARLFPRRSYRRSVVSASCGPLPPSSWPRCASSRMVLSEFR